MKLQFLGDARDAFKWDLLHWVCTTSSFSTLVYVPLLTPDDKSGYGLMPPHRFKCRGLIQPFLDSLKEEPRSLTRISKLGTLSPEKQFEVLVFAPDRFIGSGNSRGAYWSDFDPSKLENSVVFFDPDNGYIPKMRHERKKALCPEWIGHDELMTMLARLPETSVAVVYQHRPRLMSHAKLFEGLTTHLAYIHTAVVAHEPNLAFVAMAGNSAVGNRIASSIEQYAKLFPAAVTFTPLLPSYPVG